MASDAALYARAIDSASQLAVREFRKAWNAMDHSDPVACKRALLEIVPALVDKHSAMSACAAAEFYESERAAALGERRRARLAPPIERGAIEAKVRYAVGFLFEDGESDGES